MFVIELQFHRETWSLGKVSHVSFNIRVKCYNVNWLLAIRLRGIWETPIFIFTESLYLGLVWGILETMDSVLVFWIRKCWTGLALTVQNTKKCTQRCPKHTFPKWSSLWCQSALESSSVQSSTKHRVHRSQNALVQTLDAMGLIESIYLMICCYKPETL